MILNPIYKALSIVKNSNARFLVMGGQACILYGGAEFSRDLDLAITTDPENLKLLELALEELKAEQIFEPALAAAPLERGHACHFRCGAAGMERLRIDLMGTMRGCLPFEELWKHRTTIMAPDYGEVDLLSLPDLVRAKKTQRDKDWPMIRRLVDANYLQFREAPTRERVLFWLQECRTPQLLGEITSAFPVEAEALRSQRPLLEAASQARFDEVEAALRQEELRERELDRAYWAPLRSELELWRQQRRSGD